MAEKTPKPAKKPAVKTTARAKTGPKAAATRPAKAAVATRAVAKRTVARKRTAPAAAGGEQFTWRRLRRKAKVGVVVSAKMAKTVIAEVGRLREHPLYKKVIRTRKRFAAHDPQGEAKAGDLVRIQESRPFSATKRWRLVEVISRAGEAGAAAPRAAEIERMLEEAEGVREILAPVRPTEEEGEEEQKGEQ
jgi:small subunit ribosomal protein S17